MKAFFSIIGFLLLGSNAQALKLSDQEVSCLNIDTLNEIHIQRYKTKDKIVASLYDLDLRAKLEKLVFQTPTMTYNSELRKYISKNKKVEVQLYRSKDKKYGAAIEIKNENYFNDMFKCPKIDYD